MFRLWYKGLELIAGNINLLLNLLEENEEWFSTLGENFTLEAPDRVRTYPNISATTCTRILTYLQQQHTLERDEYLPYADQQHTVADLGGE
jgi:hypothetical protein